MPRIITNALIALFLLANVVGIAHMLATGDTRFGWGMFMSQTDYRVMYHWIYEDGSKVAYEPEGYLKGLALRAYSHQNHITYYGEGFAQAIVKSLVRDVYLHKNTTGANYLEATLVYIVNRDMDVIKTIYVQYP